METRHEISSLESLLGRPIRQFAAENIPGEGVLFLQGNADRYGFLDCPALSGIAELSKAFKGSDCFRVLPNRLDEAGYGAGAAIKPEDAALFLSSGMSVWVQDLNELAFFRELEGRWADELGLTAEMLYCQLFISPPGARTLRHFDVSQNLVFQLKGSKRWTVAPYDSAAGGFPQVESELIPDDTPLPGQCVLDARRGDLLCLPFCWWHSTEALTESWSLSAFVRAPTWSTLIGQMILNQLNAQPGVWGRPVIGLKDGLGTRQQLTEQLAGLLADLPRLLASLTPDRARTLLDEIMRG
jgi:hypothetical protein